MGELSPHPDTTSSFEVEAFLFDIDQAITAPPNQLVENLSADNYLALLTYSMDQYVEGDIAVVTALQRFAIYSSVEFMEPITPEKELSASAIKTEAEVSSFIESNQCNANLDVLNEKDIAHLREIYNPNNLLAFAKQLVSLTVEGMGFNQLDMVYRYRTVLTQLAAKSDALILASRNSPVNRPRDGARTWAGVIRHYGDIEVGYIDPDDYRTFSECEDPGVLTFVIDGEVQNVRNTRRPLAR